MHGSTRTDGEGHRHPRVGFFDQDNEDAVAECIANTKIEASVLKEGGSAVEISVPQTAHVYI